MKKETENFKTEVSELLQLIIHSLYSHPEIFLRELISNSSDALDKLKIEALQDNSLLTPGYKPEIRINTDKENRTLSIKDNGIGMSFEELKENLGTIARSGTKEFIRLQKELKENPELIGQFGVGFYSAFMVADSVTVETQKAGAKEAFRWTSNGKDSYSIEEIPTQENSGTTVTLHLTEKDEEKDLPDFTEEWTIRSTVKKHSDFIAYPITMEVQREKTLEGQEGEEGAKRTETVLEVITLNSQQALWLKTSDAVTDEEYNEFYRNLTNDHSEPRQRIHFRGEGTVEFSSLLFVPKDRPWNYNYDSAEYGLQLYVKRVQIMSDCEELLPPYLRFIRGVVDSSDLPLNVSREILQHDRQISQIRKVLTGRVLKNLAELKKDDQKSYLEFWKSFGATLKEGLVREPERKDKILPLCLFDTLMSDTPLSLEQYLEKKPLEQEAIYYLIGDSLSQLKASPLLERLKEKGYDVLLLSDPVDSFIEASLDKYEEVEFISASSDDLKIDSDTEKVAREEERKEAEQQLSGLLEVVKTTLKDEIKSVQLSDRLSKSAACLVNEPGGAHNAHMEQIYRSMGQEPPKPGRILELNPKHPLLNTMKSLPDGEKEEWAKLLFDQASIAEGEPVRDPEAFAERMTNVMLRAGLSGR